MVYILTLEQAQISIKIDKPFYFPGDLIKGVIYIKVKTKDINAGIMNLKLCGQQKVNQLDQQNQFFSFKQFIYKKQKKITDFGKKMPIMACRKYFEMEVPNIAPSFTINYYKLVQCRILYFLSVTIQSEDEKYLYKPPKKHRVVIHILEKPQMQSNLPMEYGGESKATKTCCFSTGSTKVKMQLNKPSYVFGENIDIVMQVDNRQSNYHIQNFKFSISAQLTILYKQQKRKISNYFDIFDQELICKNSTIYMLEQVEAGEEKEIKATFSLPQGKPPNHTLIFPQSSVKTKRIIFQYILTLKLNFGKRLFFSQEDLIIPMPIILIQHQKREKDNVFQSMENISMIGSVFETNQKISQSQLKRFIFGDHNCSGYGEQDGYLGHDRKYHPVESLDEKAMKDVKGALEQLMFKKQYEMEGSDDEDKLIEEIDGVNLNNVSLNGEQTDKQQQPKTIFQQANKNDIFFPNQNMEEAKLDNGFQDQLQTIKEEQDSKGTQYNLNNFPSSSQIRKNYQGDENEEQQNGQFQQQSYPIEPFCSFQKVILKMDEQDHIKDDKENSKKPPILKKNKSLNNSIDQMDQKEQKQFKVQFNEATSADTLDCKTGERLSTQCKKK